MHMWVSYRIGMHHDKGLLGENRSKEEYDAVYDNFMTAINIFEVKFHETTSFMILGSKDFGPFAVVETVKGHLNKDFDKIIVGDCNGNIYFYGDIEDVDSLVALGGREI
ncbi:hypothetical protein [Komagataeibacter oboediens]